MRHAGHVMGRQQLLDAVWGMNFYTESNVVDVYVRYLRRRLDAEDGPSVIETVLGVGYRIPR
jgi:DNA-binding response OmpR family regulator